MTNWERWRKEIEELGVEWNGRRIENIERAASIIAVRKDGTPVLCSGDDYCECCQNCIFDPEDDESCVKQTRRWLESEFKVVKKGSIKIGDKAIVTNESYPQFGKIGVVEQVIKVGETKHFVMGFRDTDFNYSFEIEEIDKIEKKHLGKNKKRKKTQPQIVIYQDGMTVIAKDLKTGEIGKATCGKKDTFDFDTGAYIALSRLTGYSAMLPVMLGDIGLMERDLKDFEARVKAMMGDGDMWPCDESFEQKGGKK